MKVALRAVGLILAILGVALVSLHTFYLVLGAELTSLVVRGDGALPGDVTSGDLATRSHALGAVGILVGVLTIIAGSGLLLRRRWFVWFSVASIGLALLFPPLSRLLFPSHLQFAGPDLIDCGEAAMIGMIASASLPFRSGFADT